MNKTEKKEKRHRSISDSWAYNVFTEYFDSIPGHGELPHMLPELWEVCCTAVIGWRLLSGWGRSVLIKAR